MSLWLALPLLSSWSIGLAWLAYRAGRRNGHDAGISDAAKLMAFSKPEDKR